MAKSVAKKKNRKLRRQIRKTVGALLMVTAITVAAVPVQDISANPADNEEKEFKIKVAVLDSQQSAADSDSPFKKATSDYTSRIPHACERSDSPEEQIIYSSGDGKYQFVYMRPTRTDNNKVAVILGYNPGLLLDSTLIIPETLEAYRKYTDNVTASGYCLVSKQNEFLHYVTQIQKRDEQGRGVYSVPEITQMNEDTGKMERLIITSEETVVRDGVLKYREKAPDLEAADSEDGWIYYDVEAVMEDQYNPCYYEQRENWKDVKDQDLYYAEVYTQADVDEIKEKDPSSTIVVGSLKKDNTGNLIIKQARDDDQHWKIEAEVAYIGAETVEEKNNQWVLSDEDIDEPTEGIFAEQNNITNLVIGNNIKGIGDYAFYSCGTLRSIDLSKANAVDTIGNGAFADCRNLETFNIASNANLTAIGKDAFYNCRKLTSFSVPVGVQAIGDNCFEGCVALQTVDFNGGGDSEMFLRELGYHLFKGCESLISVDFPTVYEETDVDIDMFEGCRSLQHIKIPNSKINIGKFHDGKQKDTDRYGIEFTYPTCTMTWEDFINTVPATFYFEGPNVSAIHETAKKQSIAFKYLNQELYEKMMHEHDVDKDKDNPNGTSANVLYQVNNRNELVNFVIEQGSKPDNVTIPAQIGPYGIASIGEGSFSNNCDLKKITIPASVTAIGANAFKGCHNLNTVIFTDASTITTIGTDAFKTQVVECADADTLYPNGGAKPKLNFVGAMMNDAGQDTVPFKYAMNGISNINNTNQEKIWITCHSGWPTNLEVEYNYDPIENKGEAQLVGYPRYEMINSEEKVRAWVTEENLPYVTSANKQEYLNKVLNATRYYEATDKTGMTQPTEDEMRIVTSALNVVIPSSVDSIKPGLFSGWTYDEKGEPAEVPDIGPDKKIQSVLINGVDTIEPYTFKDCESLNSADIIGSEYIGNYAFDDCTALKSVTLGTNLTDTGKRPFSGCTALTNVSCLDTDFSYSNGIIYRNTGSGTEIVECLEGRGKAVGSYTVGPDEFTGITSIKEEAFANCNEIGKVDLSFTTVDEIPEGCFRDTSQINTVILPDTVKNIEAESFTDSNIRVLTIPGNQAYIARDAFKSTDEKDQQTIIFECIEGTTADRYAKAAENPYINPEYGKVYLEHKVIFWDYPDYPDTTNLAIFEQVKVKDGEDAVPPTESPSHEGYQFSRWTNYTNISKDTDVYPVFGSNIYEVRFLDWDSRLLGEVQYVEEGRSAIPPAEPTREGHTFDRWSQDWNNVTEDRIITAIYVDNSSDVSRHTVQFYDYDGTLLHTQYINDGEDAIRPEAPVRPGYTFIGWIPADHLLNVTENRTVTANYTPSANGGSGGNGGSGSGGNGSGSGSNGSPSPSVSPSASPSESPSVTKYTVSVSGGSGSGSYAAGEIVPLNAYFMGEGQNFDKWTTSTAGVGFANPNASSTTFTMPAANVAVTATYKTGSGSTGSTGGSSGGGSTSSNNNGTTVEVTRPGFSNTGLAGATVSGATDNFIVKVTEQQAATDAAVSALQARYGDLTRIKYFPMDISLYDSTGRTKIADTSGISVNITLPLPDDMIQYAGNNRAAAVTNGALEDLNARFTTVDGVPCINFTATHFSPYVIYVDTANLSEGTIDVTPKTGDPIHPKWFLAIGLACVSLILFFKKDKMPVNTKTA